MKIEVVNVNDLHETEQFAHRFAEAIKGGMTIGLSGPLGVGKTTFIRELVAALGYSGSVTSPSYVLNHQYICKEDLLIDHWDLYRLEETPEELLAQCPKNQIRLIEWPEKGAELNGALDMHLIFSMIEADSLMQKRKIAVARR